MKTSISTADYVLRFINQTNKSLFLTGNAGTGKTTLLREIIKTTHKNTVVVAPTGIAALNAGGVTIHSMFQLPFAPFIPELQSSPLFRNGLKFETCGSLKKLFRMSAVKQSVIKNMDLLVIDEVSMLRADVLDAIDITLQTVRKNHKPFGGVQVLFIGDLLQLPPVVRNDEWDVLKHYYSGKFFFHAKAVQKAQILYIELTKIYRQTDSTFISILNNLRNNFITDQDLTVLNQYYQPDFDVQSNGDFITLTTHNAKADAINSSSLSDLRGDSQLFHAEITGDFPEKIFPVDDVLCLKEGARVMFIKNDMSSDKQYFNGKTGIIRHLSEVEVHVYFPTDDITIEVDKYEWSNVRYYVDSMTNEVREEVLGTFVQYPLKLAWAITVHKSQGLTFDKVALDVSQVFQPGQAYVALSRLTSLNGLVLLSPLQMNGICNDQDVMDFAQNKTEEDKLESELHQQTNQYVQMALRDSFDWTDLASEWQKTAVEYRGNSKNELNDFFEKNASQLGDLRDFAARFIFELDRLFIQADRQQLFERFIAAFDFFFPKLEQQLTNLLLMLENTRRSRKSKGLTSDLVSLEEMHSRVIVKLLRAKQLVNIFRENKEICRENLITRDISGYKISLYERVRSTYAQSNKTLINDGFEPLTNQKSGKKEAKKSTVSITYELWQQENSIKEIANIRKLTPQTISNHIAKLISDDQISINDIFPQDKIDELAQVFEGYHEDTLNALKEKVGNRFTWDDLKLFKASLS